MFGFSRILKAILPDFFITKILKESMLGNVLDKTYEYYFSGLVLTPIDTQVTILYFFRGFQYSITCKTEHYEFCMEYIKNFKEENNNIEFAYYTEEGFLKNVTEAVKSHAGPMGDFYRGTPFNSRKSQVCKFSKLVVIYKNGKIKKFIYPEELLE